MNSTNLLLLTIGLGELFLLILMLIGTLIIYFRFAQADDLNIDLDSIEMTSSS